MKHLLKSIIIYSFVILTLCNITLLASDNPNFIYNTNNKTITFDSDTVFNKHERDFIVSEISKGVLNNNTRGLACLFGHDYKVGTVSSITHCVSSTAPRCLNEMFEITTCTRCNYYSSELCGTFYIHCCP